MLATVLLAGGLGTRVAALTGESLPKAMLPVAGRPFIDYKLADLAEQGVDDVFVLVAHRAGPLRHHLGDGRAYGTRVHVVDEGNRRLGTGGALLRALPELPSSFFVSYADTFLPIELATIEAEFRAAHRLGLMTVLENDDRWETSNVRVIDGVVSDYRKGEPPGTLHHLDYGLLALDAAAFLGLPEAEPFDLARVFDVLIREQQLGAFVVDSRFHDIGTVEAVRDTERWIVEQDLEEKLRDHLPPRGVR
jgi:MurNAc alpha-1-phosphate uridylyltransferase